MNEFFRASVRVGGDARILVALFTSTGARLHLYAHGDDTHEAVAVIYTDLAGVRAMRRDLERVETEIREHAAGKAVA